MRAANVDGGILRVESGTYVVKLAVVVDGGTLLVNGCAFDAYATSNMFSGTSRVVAGTYTAVGLTSVNCGVIRLDRGSCTVNGDEGSKGILIYGGGVQAVVSQGITLYFRHSGEWAGDRTSQTFNGGIKVRW